MEKIKFIADTACDIPDEELREYNIDMPSVPIAVEGKEYFERKSFSILEFYDVINNTKEIPTTSRVPLGDFLECYKRALEEGYSHVICVTINAGGSGTHTSAQMAKEAFFKENPGAALEVHVIDSRTYSIAYGYPVVESAKMARAGKSAKDILSYLEDFFNRVEIYLGCYTLEYAKKSGRIGAAAAFVGEVLGLRPVIQMVDGTTKTMDKVRGDKNLAPRIFEAYRQSYVNPADPVLIVRGCLDAPVEQLAGLLKKETGRAVPAYYAGGSIVINAGPKLIAVVLLGKNRRTS